MYTSVWTGAVISAPVMSKSLIVYSQFAVFPQSAIFPCLLCSSTSSSAHSANLLPVSQLTGEVLISWVSKLD